MPMTSGDYATAAPVYRFKIIRDEVGDDGQPVVELFETHRAARRAQVEGGGKLRLA